MSSDSSGSARGHVAQVLRLRIGHVARKGDQKTHLDSPPRFFRRAREAMKNPAQPRAAPVLLQNLQAIRPGFAAMEDHRKRAARARSNCSMNTRCCMSRGEWS